jgi:hypothetical protein
MVSFFFVITEDLNACCSILLSLDCSFFYLFRTIAVICTFKLVILLYKSKWELSVTGDLNACCNILLSLDCSFVYLFRIIAVICTFKLVILHYKPKWELRCHN